MLDSTCVRHCHISTSSSWFFLLLVTSTWYFHYTMIVSPVRWLSSQWVCSFQSRWETKLRKEMDGKGRQEFSKKAHFYRLPTFPKSSALSNDLLQNCEVGIYIGLSQKIHICSWEILLNASPFYVCLKFWTQGLMRPVPVTWWQWAKEGGNQQKCTVARF